jgi:hypothetical protein
LDKRDAPAADHSSRRLRLTSGYQPPAAGGIALAAAYLPQPIFFSHGCGEFPTRMPNFSPVLRIEYIEIIHFQK